SKDGKVIHGLGRGRMFVGDVDYEIKGSKLIVAERHRIDKLALQYLYKNSGRKPIASAKYYILKKLKNDAIYYSLVYSRLQSMHRHGLVKVHYGAEVELTDEGKALYLKNKASWALPQ
ncbi:MAG TPA: hypothetical protein VKR58_00345, partial [Aquella sp.]|nr:hypothetical protein [Aquella sp.]